MIENGDNNSSLANYLGISTTSFSKKMNEKSPSGFTQPEILKIKEKYNLSAKQVDEIFFDLEVS